MKAKGRPDPDKIETPKNEAPFPLSRTGDINHVGSKEMGWPELSSSDTHRTQSLSLELALLGVCTFSQLILWCGYILYPGASIAS